MEESDKGKRKKRKDKKGSEFDNVDVDMVFQGHKYQQLPATVVKPLARSSVIELFGPDESCSAESSGSYVYCRSMSTYPRQTRAKGEEATKGARMGDPNCDCFGVQLYANRTTVAVADGCNWGDEPREAARLACATFLEYVKSKFDKVKTLWQAGHFLLRAFAHAHSRIVEQSRSTRSVCRSGTTTLLGGLLLELSEEEAQKQGYSWAFICANVGDCKAFLYSPQTRQVIDITRGNRPRNTDVCDPGGRLGPYDGPNGGPDLRNLGLFMTPCEEGSLIFVLSDGVHDNLDPEYLGLVPADMGLDIDTWDRTSEKVEKVKDSFRTKCLSKKIDLKGDEVITPELAATRLLRHCKKTTQHSRKWMQENPTRRLPTDPTKFRGKMDHCTCVAITVGRRDFQAQNVRRGHKYTVRNGVLPSICIAMSESPTHVRLVCQVVRATELRCQVKERQVILSLDAARVDQYAQEGFVLVGENELLAPHTRTVALSCAVVDAPPTTTVANPQTVIFLLEKK